jgi:hypothetical protein
MQRKMIEIKKENKDQFDEQPPAGWFKKKI